jgi:hypothetical protein
VGSLAQAQGFYSYPGIQYDKGIVSGVYTPELENLTNLDSSTARQCQWLRVGPLVTVYGQVDVNPTAIAATQLKMSLPLPSTFDTAFDCNGLLVEQGSPGVVGTIVREASTTHALLSWTPTHANSRTLIFHFSYLIKGQ